MERSDKSSAFFPVWMSQTSPTGKDSGARKVETADKDGFAIRREIRTVDLHSRRFNEALDFGARFHIPQAGDPHIVSAEQVLAIG